MRTLSCLVGLCLIATLFLLPTAAAQPKPVITVKIKWAADHDMILDETGRGDMGTVVEVFGEDFVCTQPFKFKVELDIKDLPKQFGSSMVPKVVPSAPATFFVFDQGKVGYKPASQGDKATNSPNTDANLNMAWDLDGIPKKDAKFDYVLKGQIKSEGSGACSPTPELRVIDSPVMTVKMLDRLEPENGTRDEQKCMDNPAAAGCTSTQVPIEPSTVPGPDALFLLLAIVGLLVVRKRRTT